jgi:hypothetical protein
VIRAILALIRLLPALRVLPEKLVPLAQPERKATRVIRATKVTLVQRARQVQPEQLVLLALKALRVNKEFRERLV